MELDCLILAAGASSRFESCKLLAEWQGEPLLTRVIRAADTLAPHRLVVVTGAHHTAIKRTLAPLQPNVQLCEFAGWRGGMGESLAFGASQLSGSRPLLVLLGDTPKITGADLSALQKAWEVDRTRIACAAFSGTLGVPAIFPASVKPRLWHLRGDRGAKRLLDAHALAVNMPNAAFDVDSPQDFLNLTQEHPYGIAHC